MAKWAYMFALASVLVFVNAASAADYPIMRDVAGKVVEKYQTSSCEELAAQKKKSHTDVEKRIVEMLRSNPQMRTEFINIVAAPSPIDCFNVTCFREAPARYRGALMAASYRAPTVL